MISSVYSYYLSQYGNKSNSKYDSHTRTQLKNTYSKVVKINSQTPVYKLDLSTAAQKYAIDLKEHARALENITEDLSDGADGTMTFKKSAVSSNASAVNASYITDFGAASDDESFDINVKQLACSQLNTGNYLQPRSKHIKPGEYSFDLSINDVIYEFQFKVDNSEMLALKKYDQERDWEGLHQYLNELSDDMLDDSYQIWTGNRMLDMILNQKTKDAKEKETDMQIETEVFATLPFSDREIISLFGNVLDNALEACERIQDKKRWIKIKIKKKNHLLYIETSNAIKEMPVQNQKEFVSVKEDEILHGYGMKNIQDIVRKYDGIFRYKIYGEYLVCIISIYDIRGAEEE